MSSSEEIEEHSLIEDLEEEISSYVEEECTGEASYTTISCPSGDVDIPLLPGETTASQSLFHQLVHDNDEDRHDKSNESFRLDSSRVQLENNLEPLTLKWSFGYNTRVNVVNLSGKGQRKIFVATAHKGAIYDYKTNEVAFTIGHLNNITNISSDETGRWLVTSDYGLNSVINIIDGKTSKALHTIYNEDDDPGALLLNISPNAKYIVSIHKTTTILVKIWLWTFGLNYPHGVWAYTGKRALGNPKKIEFHPNSNEHIMIVFEKQAMFFRYDTENDVLLPPTTPKVRRHLGLITDCTFAMNSHECFTSTDEGYVMIYGNVIYNEGFEEHPIDSNKIFVKAIKVSSFPILSIDSVEDKIVTVDSKGVIRFFDLIVRLLFQTEDLKNYSVSYVLFHLGPRLYTIEDDFKINNRVYQDHSTSFQVHLLKFLPFSAVYKEHSNSFQVEQIVDNDSFEILKRSEVPSVSSLNRSPFIVSCFIAVCSDGAIFDCDTVQKKYERIVHSGYSNVASIDCSSESPYLVVAYLDGSLALYNHQKMEFVCTTYVIKESHCKMEPPVENRCIKYSPKALHLALGTSNGEIWFLNPIMQPLNERMYKFTNASLKLLRFSANSKLCAFCDDTFAVYLMEYSSSSWQLTGKVRSHYEKIKDLMFTHTNPEKLFSLSQDRHIVEYELDNIHEPGLSVKSRVRIEQSAIPKCFLYYPTGPDQDPYILTSNSQQKFRMIQEKDWMCRSVILGPSHGCYKDASLKRIKVLPNSDGKYVMFSNKNHIGIQKLPPDGNPFKCIGVIGNPDLCDFVMDPSGELVFSFGRNDQTVLMWKVHKNAVDLLEYLGGTELDPYYCLIEGGAHGWFFKEMQDLFCYMQILHQGDSYQAQKLEVTLDVSELPDLFRGCGYYPSEAEIQDLLNEVKYTDFEETGKLKDQVTFVEFVKLFLNHRPTNGISFGELQDKFKIMCKPEESIDNNSFVQFLTSNGEAFKPKKIKKALRVLLRGYKPEGKDIRGSFSSYVDEGEDEYSFMPKVINYNVLSKDILGIVQEAEQKKKEEDEKPKV